MYLRDVAEVDDGFIEPRRIVEVDGRRAMMMVVADELAPKVMKR